MRGPEELQRQKEGVAQSAMSGRSITFRQLGNCRSTGAGAAG
jgi:hypothetical protein